LIDIPFTHPSLQTHPYLRQKQKDHILTPLSIPSSFLLPPFSSLLPYTHMEEDTHQLRRAEVQTTDRLIQKKAKRVREELSGNG